MRKTVGILILAATLILLMLFYGQTADSNHTTFTVPRALDTSSREKCKSPSLHSILDETKDGSSCQSIPTFSHLFDDVLKNEFDPLIVDALFDSNVLSYALKITSSGQLKKFLPRNVLGWDMSKRRAIPGVPPHFRTVDQILTTVKKYTSIGLGKLKRDAGLEHLFRRVVVSSGSKQREKENEDDPCGGKLKGLRHMIRQVIQSYASYMLTILQLIIDGNLGGDDVRKRKSLLEDLAKLTVVDSPAPTEEQPRKEEKREDSKKKEATRKSSASLLRLDYSAPNYDKQPPRNGKFWANLRPRLFCTQVERLCEMPDGCRYICNPQYLSRLGATEGHQLHFAGFGSNNEYEWEESLVNYFSLSPSNPAENKIGSITTFDCTLKQGKWSPSEVLTKNPVGMGVVSLCIDQRPSEMSMTMKDLKYLLQESVKTKSASDVPHAVSVAIPDRSGVTTVSRYKSATGSKEEMDNNGVFVRQLNIMKIDIEGYEFVVIPQWLEDELLDIQQQEKDPSHRKKEKTDRRSSGGDEVLIDFTTLSHFLPVQNLQMEFHRMGHKAVHGGSIQSVLHAHVFLLNMYALGFIMIAQERNHIDNCCYEFSFVHYRYFFESEVWMRNL